jgi:hypothetical protein
VLHDTFQCGIASGQLYGHFEFETELLDGTKEKHKGAYSLVIPDPKKDGDKVSHGGARKTKP